MSIVTLTTDFGLRDYYAGLLKGSILYENPELNLVDITHQISNFDLVQGAYILKNAYHSFPKGTIHLIAINNFYQAKPTFLVVRFNGHYFIGPDNGIFSLLFDISPEPKDIFRLDFAADTTIALFELFARAVAHLSYGKPFNEVGQPVKKIAERLSLQPIVNAGKIRGSVIHIDRFENVITNITHDLWQQAGKGRPFEIHWRRHDPLSQLAINYNEVPIGQVLCLFNSANLLEIAINYGKAASMLGLKAEDIVQVEFQI